MKQFLVFTYYSGRALGGAKDFLDSFETVDEGLENLLKERNRYFQIVERDSFRVVREGRTVFKDFSPESWEPPQPSVS